MVNNIKSKTVKFKLNIIGLFTVDLSIKITPFFYILYQVSNI